MDLKKIKQDNINKGRLLSNEVNKIKGLKSYTIARNKKEKYYNELIDELLLNNYYNKIYNIWNNNMEQVKLYEYQDDNE